MSIQTFIFTLIAVVFAGSMGLYVILPAIGWVEKRTAVIWSLGYTSMAVLATTMTLFFPNNVTFGVVGIYYLTSFVFMTVKYAEINAAKVTKTRDVDYSLLKR